MKQTTWLWVVLVLLVGIFLVLILTDARNEVLTTTPPPSQTPPPPVTEMKVDIQFMNFAEAKLPEQDVFLQGRQTGADQVVRVEGDSFTNPINLAKTLLSTANALPHDQYKIATSSLGPFPKGVSLGVTFEKWLGALGSGNYTLTGTTSMLSVNFQKLIPEATYTLWCSRMTFPPTFKEEYIPCGVDNSFKTDKEGNVSWSATVNPLQASSKEVATVIQLAYQSDGKTHGAEIGALGKDTHIQLFFILPVVSQ